MFLFFCFTLFLLTERNVSEQWILRVQKPNTWCLSPFCAAVTIPQAG
jgi:hypothetical protein